MLEQAEVEKRQIQECSAELGQWWDSPGTKRFFVEQLFAMRMLRANNLAVGAYKGKTPDDTAIRHAEIIGQIEMLDNLLAMDASGILNVEKEIASYEYFRTPPRRMGSDSQNEPGR